MADPCNAEILLATVKHGTYSYGVATAVSYELSVQDVPIRGEGKLGPSARGVIGKDLTCVVTYLTKGDGATTYAQNSDVTPADLVITTHQADGDSTLHTLKNMTTRGFAYEMVRESPPAQYRQTFAHVGDMAKLTDTTNVTVAG
jgi:hypothetical protein